MTPPTDKQLTTALVTTMTDAFNRSIQALEDSGAIDASRMRSAYAGIGSKYYDIVTEQIERTAQSGAASIRELFQDSSS